MSEYNWHLKKSNKNERRAALSQQDMDKILDWHDAFLTFLPSPSPQRDATVNMLQENTPMTPGSFEIWIMVKDLEQIKMWHKYYAQKNTETDHDKAVIAVIDQALDPKPPKAPEVK